MKRLMLWAGLFLIGLLTVSNLSAQSSLLQPFLSGLSSPVFMTNAKDGTKRLFIVQQGGIIKVVQPGSTTPTDFLNISSKIVAGGEQGLLGLAFHPQYASNRRFFIYYTRAGDGAVQIAEYQASASNPNVADTTEKVIITIPHPTNTNHNGGTIAFGADGYLYAGTGDGGGANDLPNNAQNLNILLGKMIRLDINVPAGNPAPYLNPPDNPFVGADGADEIYAYGLRNPYRWSFDRGGSRQLWAGDVGQGLVEEVDIVTKGGNYGWRIMEGTQCTPSVNPNCTPPAGHIPPVFEYFNANSPRCAVTGGYVYRGTRGALPNGSYLYGDYCTGEILLWNNNQQTLLQDTTLFISSFGEDEDGELYVVGIGGTIDKIAGNAAPRRAPFDFDGDGKTDLSIFRPSVGEWWYLRSSDGANRTFQFGSSSDRLVPADYTGDGKTDIAFWRPSTGTWFILRSEDNSFYSFPFGAQGDIPAPADYDGDGKADAAVYRPTNQTWYISRSSGGTTIQQFGVSGDVPVTADYDGDGKSDIAIYRPSQGQWWLSRSNLGVIVYQFGASNSSDIPVQGDYTGDGKADVAFFRASTGEWFILRSENNSFYSFPFGASGDVPSPGDYDGDGRTDAAVFRPSNNTWFVQRSTAGTLIQSFGISGDRSVPNAYVPIIAIAVE